MIVVLRSGDDISEGGVVSTIRQRVVRPFSCQGAALSVACSVTSGLQWWNWESESEQAVPDSVAVRGFGASQGSCDPVKVTRPELRIESGILRT